jgi:hypothetical protein
VSEAVVAAGSRELRSSDGLVGELGPGLPARAFTLAISSLGTGRPFLARRGEAEADVEADDEGVMLASTSRRGEDGGVVTLVLLRSPRDTGADCRSSESS